MDKTIYIRCEDFCGILAFTKDDEVENYYISHYTSSNNATFKNGLVNRIKAAWKILIGHNYCFYELILSKEQFEQFKKQINEL